MSDLLPRLFENNRAWAARRIAEDPHFFERLVAIQAPAYLWIGCADSRVPANEIVGLDPGELFVHRNVANLVAPDDGNVLAVLQYAVDVLKVRHVIVTGHYGCGGVQAALGPALAEPLERWLDPLRGVVHRHERALAALPDDAKRWRRLCELNVIAQVETLRGVTTVRNAWARHQPLDLHGWIYDLHDGLLRDLHVTVDGPNTPGE
jgi:carbonic anhydrase